MTTLDKLRKQFRDVGTRLATAVAEEFPIGRQVSILRRRGEKEYRIRGEVAVTAWSYCNPTRIGVRTEKRGTMMFADYQDLEGY